MQTTAFVCYLFMNNIAINNKSYLFIVTMGLISVRFSHLAVKKKNLPSCFARRFTISPTSRQERRLPAGKGSRFLESFSFLAVSVSPVWWLCVKPRSGHHGRWCSIPQRIFCRFCECRRISHRRRSSCRLFGGFCCLSPSRHRVSPPGDDSGYSQSAGNKRPATAGHRRPE